jgi:adenosine deaminase
MELHSLPAMLSAGLCVTVNSDDPAYFGGYMGNNVRAVQAAFEFDVATWRQLFRNSFTASFADAAQKRAWLAALDAHAA